MNLIQYADQGWVNRDFIEMITVTEEDGVSFWVSGCPDSMMVMEKFQAAFRAGTIDQGNVIRSYDPTR